MSHGRITLLGKEVNEISDSPIDFGLLILVEFNEGAIIKDIDLKRLSFLSNGIEGFSIRTIPRKFWCRISKFALNHGFSLEFLGKAIILLYKQKFLEKIKAKEVIFINTYISSINQLLALTADLSFENKENWRKKIEEWRKRIDCEYDWGCEICPYREECDEFRKILLAREEI